MSGGKGSKSQTVTNSVSVPEFLQPFLHQSANTGSGALANLQGLFSGDTVSNLTPNQQQGISMARNVAEGGGGFIPTAQDEFLSTAQGRSISDFIPDSALSSLSGGNQFLDSGALSSLQSFGVNSPERAELDPAAISTLQQTANGDFLADGPGFTAAVDAAVRAARPGIMSTFGRAGAGGSTSGLAQQAIGESAIDAFAGQYGQERNRQLSAANALTNLGLADRQQGLSERQQQIGALGLLSNVGQGEAVLNQSGAGTLANLSNAERSRQLQAANALPGLSLAGADILSQIGSVEQNQNQRELLGPINAQQQLLGASLGITPSYGTLFGGTTSQPVSSNGVGNALGGAAIGAQLSGNNPWAALGGGLLGGFLS